MLRPLWHWGLDRLPSRKEGYTLDLDSTRLPHKDGHHEGVAGGYTRRGIKPCLHPLLALLAEVRLVAQLHCSRKSPRLQRTKPYQKSIPTASFRLILP